VERDSITFRVDDHRAKTMFANLLSRAQNFPAVLACLLDGVVQSTFDKKINQRPIRRRRVIDAAAVASNAKTTGCVPVTVREQTVFSVPVGQFPDLAPEHGGIKFNRAIEVVDRNIGPTKRVGRHLSGFYFIKLTHGNFSSG